MAKKWLGAFRNGQHSLSAEDGRNHRTEIRSSDSSPDGVGSGLTNFMATGVSMDDGTADEEALLDIPPRVGPWRRISLLGRGGMGQVWLVERDDGTYRQLAALKLLASRNPILRTHFAEERQRLAQLEHPHIARIVDGGDTEDGRAFMVIDYVEGQPIDQWCAAHATDRQARTSLLVDLCSALAHAHGRLVLHLDIKASNVLINTQGQLKLIDFGIAVLMPSHASDGVQGTIRALTLATAAPEQLDGGSLTVATDIFQVGILGHLLLAGKLPEREAGGSVTIRAEHIGDTDLTAILRKATRAEPSQRYASADALAEDLINWQTKQPVSARETGSLYRTGLFLRRHWLATSAVLLAFTALTVVLSVSIWQMREAVDARNLALAEEQRSDVIRESAYFLLSDLTLQAGGGATVSGISAAAQTMGERFDRSPSEFAALLQALGELQYNLSDDKGALVTLGKVIERAGEIQPEILAQAQYNAARSLVRQGEFAEAEKLLLEAQRFWRRDSGRWSTRLLDSRSLEAQLLRADDPEAALALLQSTLAEHIGQYGDRNQRAGAFYNNIGTSLAAMNRLDEAELAFQKADAIWREIGLSSGFDALNTLNNIASVYLFQNKPERAAEQYARAVELRDRLFGPSAATGALHSNYGKALLATGKVDDALEEFAYAEKLALEYSGEGTPLHIAVLLGQAEALARSDGADPNEKLRAVDRYLGTMGDPALLRAVYHLSFAKVLIARNAPQEAKAMLRKASALAKESGPAGDRIGAEAQRLLGS